jgi:hypothetical protein
VWLYAKSRVFFGAVKFAFRQLNSIFHSRRVRVPKAPAKGTSLRNLSKKSLTDGKLRQTQHPLITRS